MRSAVDRFHIWKESISVKELAFDPKDTDVLNKLRRIPVFDAMDEEQLPRLLKTAKLRRYATGETIIAEGDTDQGLYFLILGSCTVDVDGVEVSPISRLGDVFGEMSIIDRKPRSATIVAEQQTLCLALDCHFLEQLQGVDKTAAQALFYRIFSENLAARVRDANSRILTLEDRLKELSVERPLL